jgi:hypothetical protein
MKALLFPLRSGTIRVLFIFIVLGAALPARSQTATNLALLGTNNPSPFVSSFVVDTESFTTAAYTQGNSTLTLNVPFLNGQTLLGAFGSLETPVPFDWSGEEQIALSLSANVAPNVSLRIEFLGADYDTLSVAQVVIGGIAATPTTVEFDFEDGYSIQDLSGVNYLYFFWGGDSYNGPIAPIDTAVTIHGFQAVPEPSTFALLAMVAGAWGAWAVRRRR